MGHNQGFENEHIIINALNGQLVNALPIGLRKMMTFLFPQGGIGRIEVGKLNNEQKADIYIAFNNQRKYLSLKSGNHLSFHAEPVELFIGFLRTLGITNKTLKTLLFFHFGDRTLNGQGSIRFTSDELRRTHYSYFKDASIELSKPEVMKAIIHRTIIQGRFSNNYPIDGVYYGDPIGGKFISITYIKQMLLAKKYQRKNGTINLRSLTYQPKGRNLFRYPNAEPMRFVSVIKWRSFPQDIGFPPVIKRRNQTSST